MERYSVFLRIRSEYGKMLTRKTPNTDTFYAVLVSKTRTKSLLENFKNVMSKHSFFIKHGGATKLKRLKKVLRLNERDAGKAFSILYALYLMSMEKWVDLKKGKFKENLKMLLEVVRTVANEQVTLREKCPYLELLWSTFSHIWAEYGEILCISPYSVRMRENAD